MALKLDENPNAIYDAEPQNPLTGGLGAGDTENGIASRESGASPSDGVSGSRAPGEDKLKSGDDTVGKGHTSNSKKVTGKFGFTRKKGIVGGAVSAGIATPLIVGFMAFPGFIVNTIGDIINGKSGAFQNSESLRYGRKNIARLRDAFTLDGRRGGKIIAEMQRSGYAFSFGDGTNRNAVTAIQRPGSSASLTPDQFARELNDYMEARHPFRSAKWKTRRMNAFYNRYAIPRSSVVSLPRGSSLNPRELVNRHFYSNSIRGAPTFNAVANNASIDVDANPAQADFNEQLADMIRSNDAFADIDKFLADGGVLENYPDKELARAYREVPVGGPNAYNLAQNAPDGRSIGSVNMSTIRGVALSTDFLDKICTLNKRLASAVTAARIYRSLALMRYSMIFLTAQDGIKKGEAQADLVREVMRRIVSADYSGRYIGSSQGINYALSGTFNKSRNDLAKPAFGTDGKLTGFYGKAKEETDWITGCSVWQNPFAQVGFAVGEIVLTVFTGGQAKIAITGSRITAQKLIERSLTTVLRSTLTKRFVVVGTINLTLEGLMALGQMHAQKMLTSPLSAQEGGQEGADLMMAGAEVAHKQRGLESGLVPAEADEYQAAYDRYLVEKKETLRKQSLYTRLFDRNNLDSLAFSGASHVAVRLNNPQTVASTLSNSVLSAPKTLATSILDFGTGGAYAQDDNQVAFDVYETTNGIRLATGPSGTLLTYMPDSISNIDPVANEKELIEENFIDPITKEPRGDFEKHVEWCVDNIDTISVIEELPQNKVATDCLAKEDTTKKFKAHLAWLDLQDRVDASFFPEEINDGTQQPTQDGGSSTTLNAAGLNGYAIPCEGLPTPVIRLSSGGVPRSDWSNIRSSGEIGIGSDGTPINVYIREACDQTNVKTIFIGSSIHGSEAGGQLVSHELLFNTELPRNIRIIAVPEINKYGVEFRGGNGYGGRVNANGVNLNRNFNFNWSMIPAASISSGNFKGAAPESEPETKALVSFLSEIGVVDLLLAYHDDINWVAATNATPVQFAQIYGAATVLDTPVRPAGRDPFGKVFQRGSLDAWYNEAFGAPSMLIEMSPRQDEQVINGHVNAVKAIIDAGIL